MASRDYEFYKEGLSSLESMYFYIDAKQEDTRMRHQLNNYLGFGLSMEDVVLTTFINSTWSTIRIDAFPYWVRHKLYSFLAHEVHLWERLKLKKSLVYFSGAVETIIKERINKTTNVGNSGENFTTTVEEIKAVIMIRATLLELEAYRETRDDCFTIRVAQRRCREIMDSNYGQEDIPPEIIELLKKVVTLDQ